ncbi:MAG: lysine--tRNA ligase [Candidatus Levybacteria bacterium]|nr:lysine--tRNA ligase [Candidatus Levybacteria bacterium]
MFWADKLLEGRTGEEWINDAWTPSGIVHMGGLKGPVIHDVLFKILKKKNRKVNYTFGFDDMDAIDGLPEHLEKTHGKYMGIPICNAPSPDGKGSFGDYYGNMMRDLFDRLDIDADIYLASDYYKKGVYNKAIEFVLNNADGVRKVYANMYKKEIRQLADWYPLQIVCPHCGKVGTTEVTNWDGKEVSFICKPDKVKWAKGCEFTGKISPYDGKATMPFKVEWAAKWWTFGVTIEAAGKDHASAGGTYDVARKICKDVFGKEPPLALPYEFFLYDGRKMSSSKGLGLTGEELLEVLPPQLIRFLMIKTPPNQAIEFNPNQTDVIPKLYDDYQKAAQSNEDYLRRSYIFSQINTDLKPPKLRFNILTQWVQMPNMEDQIKKENLEEWTNYVKVWLKKYASDEVKFEIKEKIPEDVAKLGVKQKEFLGKVSRELEKEWGAEEFQRQLYEWAKEINLSSNEAFQALYISIIGKDHGPKAAWLILENKNLVKKRFEEIASA